MSIKKKILHSVLSTTDLSIGYSGKVIASGINLEVIPGELTAVVGVNGSGKSTLLKTLTADLPQQSGNIFLGDQSIDNFSSKTISEHISIVLTKSFHSQNLSVRELVALGRHPYTNWLGILNEKDKLKIESALRQIGIEDLAHQKCDELSDGQLQKVFIARAIAQDTELIVLDEPTNHLDLYHKYFVFKLLKKLVKTTQKSVVFASHELNLVLQLCDKIILLSGGKIIQDSPQNLIKNKHLEQIFPDDLVVFDPKLESFRIKEE